MVLLAHLDPTEPRVRLDLLAHLVLLVFVVLLVTVVRVVLLGLLVLLDLLVLMVSLVPRESSARVDRREKLVPLDLRDHPELLDPWDLLV